MTGPPDLVRLTSPDGRLEAFIAPDMGAELCGLAWDGRELLHRGRNFSPAEGWPGRAPILWPAIGRTFAPGPEPTPETFRQAPLGWVHDGVLHPMPMHGFARSRPWLRQGRTISTLRLGLSEDQETRRFYPFGFRLGVDYRLDDGGLTLDHRVRADPANAGPMPFALGNHATFTLPTDGSREAVSITSNADRRMALDAAGRPTGLIHDEPGFLSPAPVTAIKAFDVIALAASRGDPWVRLADPAGVCLTISHRPPTRGCGADGFITLWGDPANGYLAIEPWLGKPNALSSGEGLCHLAPGASLTWSLAVAVDAGSDLSASHLYEPSVVR